MMVNHIYTTLRSCLGVLQSKSEKLPPMQVHLPIATVDGCPVGLGLIGPRGTDESLLELTEQLMHILQPS